MTSLLRRQRPLLAGLVALSLGACARSALDEELPEEPGPLPVVAEPPCGRFELRGELAIDKGSGLQWTRFVRLAFASHEEASAHCASLGMRLPVRAELQALLEPGRRACDLPCGFSGHGCATLICDSPIPGTDSHWGVSFQAGTLVGVGQTEQQGFVCVRDP